MSTMRQYLISIQQPDGDPPPREILEPVMRQLEEVNRDLKAAGSWVFSRGLFPPSTATIVHLRDGEILTTDGPYAEGKEHLGGIVIISVPDLDAALVWAKRLARIITLPIEVRPFQDEAPQ